MNNLHCVVDSCHGGEFRGEYSLTWVWQSGRVAFAGLLDLVRE